MVLEASATADEDRHHHGLPVFIFSVVYLLLCYSELSLSYTMLARASLGLSTAAAVVALLDLTSAATLTHDFNITWTTANPDGAFSRPVIGINGKWPIPRITATVGDRIVINVNNQLGNQSTSLHFHGLYQNGTTHMDGPAGVSQCGIAPGASFTYNFTVWRTR